MFQGRIVLAGADVNQADIISCVLERRGYEVHAVHAPGKLFSLIQKDRPHLVILDQKQMGRVSGADLCRQLREIFTREEIPILYLARAGDEGPILEGMEAGANECLSLPLKAHELIAKTTILIQRKKRDQSRRLARRTLHRVIAGESADLSEGITFGPWVLTDVLGRGCMGAVFLACHAENGDTQALKVLDPDLHADGRAMKRLQREGQILMQIRHPNIVRVHKVSQHDGFHFLAMEYVQGPSLIRRLDECGPEHLVDAREAFDIVLQVASALDAMWKSGLIHRDVKPENILITPAGTVKLVDFGLARSDKDERLTRSGIIYGTPNYMSPEQIQGFELDFKTDIYSLGATAYHLLTGSPPFESPSTRGILYRHVFENIRPPDRNRPDLPRAASAVVCRMMEKEPGDRYASAAELLAALEEAKGAVADGARGRKSRVAAD